MPDCVIHLRSSSRVIVCVTRRQTIFRKRSNRVFPGLNNHKSWSSAKSSNELITNLDRSCESDIPSVLQLPAILPCFSNPSATTSICSGHALIDDCPFLISSSEAPRNQGRTHWNTLRIFHARARHRWLRIVRRSRKVHVGRVPGGCGAIRCPSYFPASRTASVRLAFQFPI